MKFEISFATYGIQKSGSKQGFQIYSSIGFIDEFELSDKFKLFQTPSEMLLVENESLYSVSLLSTDEYGVLFLNHHWFTGKSEGYRNCYDGFSMIFKYFHYIPNIISIAQEYVNLINLVKDSQTDLNGLFSNLSLDLSDNYELDSDNKYRTKRKIIEFHSAEGNIKSIIQNVLESVLGRNNNRRFIYFTQDFSLFDRINTISIDKINRTTTDETESNNYLYQIESKYKSIVSEKEKSINAKEEYLSKLKSQIQNAEDALEVLSSKYEKENKRLKSILVEHNAKSKEIKLFEKRIKKLKKWGFKYLSVNKRILLIWGTILMIISSIITLAITLYIVHGG